MTQAESHGCTIKQVFTAEGSISDMTHSTRGSGGGSSVSPSSKVSRPTIRKGKAK